MSAKKFAGTFTALATPFKGGNVDWEAFKNLVGFQIENGVNGFVVNGTTGESPTVSVSEVEKLFWTVRDLAPTQTVVLGVGTNSTKSTLEWVKLANEWKADGTLAVVPYYNKPPQRGLIKHFKAIADISLQPVILYNVPSRTVTGLEVDSIVELSKHPMIAGIKESTGDISLMEKIKAKVDGDFSLLSGDDGTAVEFTVRGGDGVIGVATHIIPKKFSALIERAQNGDESTIAESAQLKTLIDSLYVEANPIAVKSALYLMGIFSSPELRLPMVALEEENLERLKTCLKNHGLL